MEYTVQKLGEMAGVSARTLRYYDEIGILKPARINSSGYRIYGQGEVDRLQQVLFYKELGVSLENIRAIINAPAFDRVKALRVHYDKLLEKKARIDTLLTNISKTIALAEGRISMTDKEKFEGFKEKLVKDNEDEYGEEIKEKYGDEAVERSNRAFKNMTGEEYDRMLDLDKQVKLALAEAYKDGDPAGEPAQRAAELHKKWLTICWGHYDREAHAGLAQMYVDDKRFTAYYDKEQPGTAELLRDAVYIYTGEKE